MRGLRVVAVPIRVEPVPHLEAARERLLSALLAGYRKLAAAEVVRPHPPRLLHGASTPPPAGAREPEGRERRSGEPAGWEPVPGGGGAGATGGPPSDTGSLDPSPPAGAGVSGTSQDPAAAGTARTTARRAAAGAGGARLRSTPWPAGLVVLSGLGGLLPLSALAGEPPRWDGRLAALARQFGDAAAEVWSEWAAQAARTLGIYLCPGTVVVPQGEGFEHVALCFGPDGRLLARQAQLHATPEEAALGLIPGDDWTPFTLGGWTASLVVGRDGWIPEVGRWASLEGVRLVLHPGHALDAASRWDLAAGPWQVVQQTQVYWVHAAPSGQAGTRNLVPQAAIFAPCEITPAGRGWLAWEDGGEPAAAVLEAPALAAVREQYPLDRYLHPALYLRQLLPAYRRLAGATGMVEEGQAAPGDGDGGPVDPPPALPGLSSAPAAGEPAPRDAGRARRRPAGRRRRRARRAGPAGLPQHAGGAGRTAAAGAPPADAAAAREPGRTAPVAASPPAARPGEAEPASATDPGPGPAPCNGPEGAGGPPAFGRTAAGPATAPPGRKRRRRKRRPRAAPAPHGTGPGNGGNGIPPAGGQGGSPASSSGTQPLDGDGTGGA
ncbi:carbon-nitrogen hydrolase family protein [Thermaerobacter sp. PB12/4term]|uniref:carbon-nitrogen hydrolase family protein n=1 Tax=Thermaerobacter sp. PB12/4term TaxID=2293838 RepID=UPI000E3A94A0|nr:carbon-nitrogen hydrolase family protein [Thermaerobacter sp. PB12/4term]QIA26793.1 carbon-nitrogen hydrolase family protein [Thermaerobacter sp. PB12/4term]